ncbi:MAG: hypothetical protein ABJD13_06475 [Paracoccaceae bacterium]
MTAVWSTFAGQQPLVGHPNGPGYVGPALYGVFSVPQEIHTDGGVVFY